MGMFLVLEGQGVPNKLDEVRFVVRGVTSNLKDAVFIAQDIVHLIPNIDIVNVSIEEVPVGLPLYNRDSADKYFAIAGATSMYDAQGILKRSRNGKSVDFIR